jgi:hypothetical protein
MQLLAVTTGLDACGRSKRKSDKKHSANVMHEKINLHSMIIFSVAMKGSSAMT